jgi:hypothetical protein
VLDTLYKVHSRKCSTCMPWLECDSMPSEATALGFKLKYSCYNALSLQMLLDMIEHSSCCSVLHLDCNSNSYNTAATKIVPVGNQHNRQSNPRNWTIHDPAVEGMQAKPVTVCH